MIEVIIDGKKYCINGRTEEMIEYLVYRQRRIDGLDKGRIIFDFGGTSLQKTFQEVDESTIE